VASGQQQWPEKPVRILLATGHRPLTTAFRLFLGFVTQDDLKKGARNGRNQAYRQVRMRGPNLARQAKLPQAERDHNRKCQVDKKFSHDYPSQKLDTA
jgi:hypothetical protein